MTLQIFNQPPIKTALECGYRLFDTATHYKNEDVVGNEINFWISEGRLKREELYVVTKVG